MARSKERMSTVINLKGLDLMSSSDLIADGRTPYSKNFRLYAQSADDRRVTVSSRKGPGLYIAPNNEHLMISNDSVNGMSIAKVGIVMGVHMIKFKATSSDRLTRVDIKVSDSEEVLVPLRVCLYSNNNDKPGKMLSETCIPAGSIGSSPEWATARFINAVKLATNEYYWIVLSVQDDGKGSYDLATTVDGTKAYSTNSALDTATQRDYSINYKVYVSSDMRDKGGYRFNRDNGRNITVIAYGDTMYYIDESKNMKPIISGLSSLAKEYKFTNGDNKVFWVNGYDKLTSWNGTNESTAINIVNNGSFSVNTTDWSAISGTTMSRISTEYHSSPASIQLSATSGIRGASVDVNLLKNKRYKITYWAKANVGNSTTFMTVNNQATAINDSTKPSPSSWAKFEMYYTPGSDVSTLQFKNTAENFFLDDVSIVDTGVEYYVDDRLPILSDITMHKDRIWGVVASEPDKVVFSENPGNPAYDPTGVNPTSPREQWYHAWLSVSYWYIPRPFNGSPITSLTSFQDSLIITTQDNKYVLSGYDRGSFNLRQSTGNKGAISRRGVTSDENSIYFVGNDGFYIHNGSSDKKISVLISPLFDACPKKGEITPVLWKNQVRFYMASEFSNVNDICAIYDKDLGEWLLDTDLYIDRAISYTDADDNMELVELSSQTSCVYLAEQDYNNLGGPIDFEYRLKYDSMGTPMQRKRLKRFYPILQGVDTTFKIQLAMDKDFQNSPKIKEQLLTTNGAKWGEFKWGDSTIYGGNKSFKPKKQSYSGYARYWQLRVARKAANNRVEFMGAQYLYKTKRL